jgi:hypothetical protein
MDTPTVLLAAFYRQRQAYDKAALPATPGGVRSAK